MKNNHSIKQGNFIVIEKLIFTCFFVLFLHFSYSQNEKLNCKNLYMNLRVGCKIESQIHIPTNHTSSVIKFSTISNSLNFCNNYFLIGVCSSETFLYDLFLSKERKTLMYYSYPTGYMQFGANILHIPKINCQNHLKVIPTICVGYYKMEHFFVGYEVNVFYKNLSFSFVDTGKFIKVSEIHKRKEYYFKLGYRISLAYEKKNKQ